MSFTTYVFNEIRKYPLNYACYPFLSGILYICFLFAAKRFFCFRHSTPVSRFSKPKRKRSAEDFKDDVYKENIPEDVIDNVGPTQPKVSTPSRSPKKNPGKKYM